MQYGQKLFNHLSLLMEADQLLGLDQEREAARREIDELKNSDPSKAKLDARLFAVVNGGRAPE